MQPTDRLQATPKVRLEQACEDWRTWRPMQKEAERLLVVCERSCRRDVHLHAEADGLEELIDRRWGLVSQQRAPVAEVLLRCRTSRPHNVRVISGHAGHAAVL
jgi:hypothetical protein